MTMLVTLTEAKSHLRVDTSDEDTHITLLVHAASGAVLNYIESSNPDYLDSAGDVIEDSNGLPIGIPFEVQAATLLLIGYLYKDRDNNGLYKMNGGGNFEHGYLPRPVIALLYHYRYPAMS